MLIYLIEYTALRLAARPFPCSTHITPIDIHGQGQARGTMQPLVKGKTYVSFSMVFATWLPANPISTSPFMKCWKIPCLLWIPDFWKGQNSFEKKQIIIFKKVQNIEISHSISTILTNDPKYSIVADVKIYAIIVAIWGCLLCIISSHFLLTKIL